VAPRLRALLVTAAVACTAVAVAGVAVLGRQSSAFTVNGEEWSRDNLAKVLTGLVEAGQFTSSHGRVAGTDAASVASVLVQYRAGAQMLAERGVKIPEADRTAVTTQIRQTFRDPFVVAVLADMSVTGAAVDKLTVPANMKSLYEKSPALTGVLCAAEITVGSESEARDALVRIDGGEKFLDVAKAVTISPDFKQTGGVVGASTDMPCSTLNRMSQRISSPLLNALLHTPAGTRTAIVRDNSGWHIASNRPWQEIAAAHAKVFSAEPGRNLADGYTATSDIHVNPIYGTWNAATSKIE
jgi:hypothetical protein